MASAGVGVPDLNGAAAAGTMHPMETPANPWSLGISVVVPVFNEEGSVGELARRLAAVLETMGTTWEVIFVDDGSRDRTVEILRQANLQEPRVKVVRFRRNFGQTAALAAGFDFAGGEIIVTMDGDLQNDPADIPRLVAKIGEGFDLVNGWRVKRQDTFLTRRLPSMIANSLISFITGVKLHDYGCTLKAFRHEVAKHVSLYGELHRFIPAIASGMGVEVAEIPVNHHPRTTGKSKYGLFRTVKVLLDLITVKFLLSYSTRPIHIFGLIGLVSAAFGVGIGGWLSYQRLFQSVALANRPILFLAVLLVIVGIQFVTMGLLAELQTRIYHESKKRPTYMVREKLGL
jgi:glycosyltransferase involved in cell wall biosynthesis